MYKTPQSTPKCLEHTFERLNMSKSILYTPKSRDYAVLDAKKTKKSRRLFLSPDGYLAQPRLHLMSTAALCRVDDATSNTAAKRSMTKYVMRVKG